ARQVPIGDGTDAAGYIDRIIEAWELGWPKPRVVVLSFPHNPTTTVATKEDLQRLVDWARDKDVVLVHDLAYADMTFDGFRPPAIMECDGAREVAEIGRASCRERALWAVEEMSCHKID